MELEHVDSIQNFLKQKEEQLPELWAVYNDFSRETRLEAEKNGEKEVVKIINEKGEETLQEISSANTSRSQLPKSLKSLISMKENIEKLNNDKKIVLFDIGCGHGNEKYADEIKKLGMDYNGCDLYNQNKQTNIDAIKKCASSKSDIVVNNNVLNAIKEKEIREAIIAQCKDAVNPETGFAVFLTYEGELNSFEKKQKKEGISVSKTPIQTKDGWQNRFPTKNYVSEVKKIFPNVIMSNVAGATIIIAAKNPELKLDKVLGVKNSLEVKNKQRLR